MELRLLFKRYVKVRTVDSAQGQEADHIIFGVTRTAKVGFLKNQRRTNVALTRCKKSLIILGSFDFMEGIGSKTLIGKLYSEMKDNSKIVSYHDVLNGKKILNMASASTRRSVLTSNNVSR